MPIIGNINGAYASNTRKISSKLSFDIDEVFVARIVNRGEDNDILLKLLDGWEFVASLDDFENYLPEGLAKFKVTGFEEGKLLLELLSTNVLENKSKENDSIDTLLLKENIDLSETQYEVLEKMVKHNIPLTKENIFKVMNLSDFIDKLKQNPEEGNIFIDRYLESRNIDLQSEEGQNVKNIITNLIDEFKNINQDDILTLIENSVDLTPENIKSFREVFKENHTIYNDLQQLDSDIRDNNMSGKAINVEIDKSEVLSNIKSLIYSNKEENINIAKQLLQEMPLEKLNLIEKELTDKEKQILNTKDSSDKNTIENKDIEKNISSDLKNAINIDKANKQVLDKFTEIKNEISGKTLDMKNIIKELISNSSDSNNNSQLYDKIIGSLKNNINNFKMFNTISNEYYYMDVPLNLQNKDYECKIIIKDERGKGKQIDKKNVKIATSITTENMGIVDAYIKVTNFNMDVNIKTNEEWMKYVNSKKNKLVEDLMTMGYSISIKVEEKLDDLNLSNSREFFNDNNLGTINARV
ncbi:hypothetical protein [Clostridium niameyense]|uniref:hypothetical protein n=1 Tax=Clostridium niameyense TaxID=1622073 RepID=UPI00067F0714|nr:hypothetical protein [Clostridium niameyense]